MNNNDQDKKAKIILNSEINNELEEDKPDFVLILPWNIADELVLQLDYVKQWGGTLFTAVPTLRFYE